jgi:hypothetical protein
MWGLRCHNGDGEEVNARQDDDHAKPRYVSHQRASWSAQGLDCFSCPHRTDDVPPVSRYPRSHRRDASNVHRALHPCSHPRLTPRRILRGAQGMAVGVFRSLMSD